MLFKLNGIHQYNEVPDYGVLGRIFSGSGRPLILSDQSNSRFKTHMKTNVETVRAFRFFIEISTPYKNGSLVDGTLYVHT